MKKYISINDTRKGKITSSHIMLLPEHVTIESHLGSDGTCVTLFDQDHEEVYGIMIDVKDTKLCKNIEGTEFAEDIESGLTSLTQHILVSFLQTGSKVLNLEDYKVLLEGFTNDCLTKLQELLEKVAAELERDNKKKKHQR